MIVSHLHTEQKIHSLKQSYVCVAHRHVSITGIVRFAWQPQSKISSSDLNFWLIKSIPSASSFLCRWLYPLLGINRVHEYQWKMTLHRYLWYRYRPQQYFDGGGSQAVTMGTRTTHLFGGSQSLFPSTTQAPLVHSQWKREQVRYNFWWSALTCRSSIQTLEASTCN